MPEKELRKKVIGKNGLSNSLLALKIVFDLIPQILLVYLISSLIANNISEDNLKHIFLGIFISFALKGVFYYFATKVAHEKAYEKLTELRLDIIGHLKKLSLGFFKEHNTGELTNIVQHDVEQVEVYLAHGLPEIMSVTLLPTIIFVAMIFVDWRLALGMIAGVPLMYLVKVLSQKTMDKNFSIYFNHENKMREELMEYVKNISVIKAFAKEEEISERTLKTAREYIYWVKKSMEDTEKCNGCGMCAVFCPTGAIRRDEAKKSYRNPRFLEFWASECVQCGLCVPRPSGWRPQPHQRARKIGRAHV